ncbi:MAG: hypothetical protein RI957_1145 [Verrucomicrobiota bacterium]
MNRCDIFMSTSYEKNLLPRAICDFTGNPRRIPVEQTKRRLEQPQRFVRSGDAQRKILHGHINL